MKYEFFTSQNNFALSPDLIKAMSKNPDKQFLFTVQKLSDKDLRSSEINRYFHGVLLPQIADYIGETTDNVKLIMKEKFLKETKIVLDVEISYLVSTATLTNEQFLDFCQKIIDFCYNTLDLIIEPYHSK